MSARTKDALRMASLAIDALEVIQGFTKLGGDKAAASLAAIDKIIAELQDGFEGKTTPDVIEAELEQLRAQLNSNDSAIDQAITDKFRNATDTPGEPSES